MEWRAGHGARTLRRSRSHPGLAQLWCVEASPAGKEVLISGENGTISPPAMLLGDIPILQEQECSLSWNLFQHGDMRIGYLWLIPHLENTFLLSLAWHLLVNCLISEVWKYWVNAWGQIWFYQKGIQNDPKTWAKPKSPAQRKAQIYTWALICLLFFLVSPKRHSNTVIWA